MGNVASYCVIHLDRMSGLILHRIFKIRHRGSESSAQYSVCEGDNMKAMQYCVGQAAGFSIRMML